jgi:hypothetical protein
VAPSGGAHEDVPLRTPARPARRDRDGARQRGAAEMRHRLGRYAGIGLRPRRRHRRPARVVEAADERDRDHAQDQHADEEAQRPVGHRGTIAGAADGTLDGRL